MNEEYKRLFEEARMFLGKEWDYSKLTAVEKLTVLLSAIAILVVLMVLGCFALYFLSASVVNMLVAAGWSSWSAYLLLAGVFIVLLLLAVALKKRLIVNPVARYLSRLLLKPSDNERKEF